MGISTISTSNIDTIATSNIERDSYIVRTIYANASDKDLTFVVAYSYKEHERQKLFRRINRRKPCGKCGERLIADSNNFYKRSSKKGGELNKLCKICDNIKRKENYAKNRELSKNKAKEHYYANREEINLKRRGNREPIKRAK